MELASGHEPPLALSNRGALSILDASFMFARVSHQVSGEPWSTGFSIFSAVVGVFAGLMSASVRTRQKKGLRVRDS